MKRILDKNAITKSNRQPKNLRHLLTNAKFTDNITEIPYPSQKFQNVDEQPVVFAKSFMKVHHSNSKMDFYFM